MAQHLQPGDPVLADAITQQGSTFAARAKAAAKASKAVTADDAEDKAVTSASTKARKPAVKKG